MDTSPSDRTEPFIAWRGFNISYTRPFWEISSPIYRSDEVIEPVKAIATCAQYYDELTKHKAPDMSCGCGWYAFKSYKKVDQSYWLAKVRLYGTVMEYTEGYRAEKMDILEMWPPAGDYSGNDLLERQFPTIQWHLPEQRTIQQFTPKQMAEEVTHIHVDPMYDVLPAEIIDQLLPSQYYQVLLPFFKHAAYGMSVRFMTQNHGVMMEWYDQNNTRILGPILFSGSRYHWYGPDGKPLPPK